MHYEIISLHIQQRKKGFNCTHHHLIMRCIKRAIWLWLSFSTDMLGRDFLKIHVQWNLSWETTCLERPAFFWQKVLYFNAIEPVTKDNLSWKTTSLWPIRMVFQGRFYCTDRSLDVFDWSQILSQSQGSDCWLKSKVGLKYFCTPWPREAVHGVTSNNCEDFILTSRGKRSLTASAIDHEWTDWAQSGALHLPSCRVPCNIRPLYLRIPSISRLDISNTTLIFSVEIYLHYKTASSFRSYFSG